MDIEYEELVKMFNPTLKMRDYFIPVNCSN